MNLETGEVILRPSQIQVQEAMKSGKFIELDNPPDPNCKKCYGRGHVGRSQESGLYIPCSCVLKKARR